MNSLYTINDVASILKFSRRQVHRWISSKHLNVVRFGRTLRVSASEIERVKSVGIHGDAADILQAEVGCKVKSRSRRKVGSLWE